MSDEPDDDQPQPDDQVGKTKTWRELTGHERILFLRAERERHRFPVREQETNDNASGDDDEYDPFARLHEE